MALSDYFKGPEHRAAATRLEAELQSHRLQSRRDQEALQAKYDELVAQNKALGLFDLLAVQDQIRTEHVLLANTRAQIASHEADLAAAQRQLQELQAQILGAEDAIQLESFALYEPKFQFTNSAEYKKRLDENREAQKSTARGLSAEIDAWDNYAVEFTKAQWKKMRKDVMKLALRSFNSESDYCVDNVKFSNLDKMEERIRRSFATCNTLVKAVGAFWKDIVLERKLEELYLAHEYQMKRQEEKEAIRQAREDQREQEKLDKEIRETRAKIDKERRHFTGAIQKLQLRLTASTDPQERSELQTRIKEITGQSVKLDDEERLLDYREQNARAGYVYVISNIGAFGEGIFKVGMTRRLEPMDRVDELGDASVPFRFDVHALVFSDNAPALEAKLHTHFAAGRLNKVNGRKEFFRADLKEIEAVSRTAPSRYARRFLPRRGPVPSGFPCKSSWAWLPLPPCLLCRSVLFFFCALLSRQCGAWTLWAASPAGTAGLRRLMPDSRIARASAQAREWASRLARCAASITSYRGCPCGLRAACARLMRSCTRDCGSAAISGPPSRGLSVQRSVWQISEIASRLL